MQNIRIVNFADSVSLKLEKMICPRACVLVKPGQIETGGSIPISPSPL